jgi:hypothetical protein
MDEVDYTAGAALVEDRARIRLDAAMAERVGVELRILVRDATTVALQEMRSDVSEQPTRLPERDRGPRIEAQPPEVDALPHVDAKQPLRINGAIVDAGSLAGANDRHRTGGNTGAR